MNKSNTPKLELIVNNQDKPKEKDLRILLLPGQSTGTDDQSGNDSEEGYRYETKTGSHLNMPFAQRKHLKIATEADIHRESDNSMLLSQLFIYADEWYLNNNPFRYCDCGWSKTPLNHRSILQINIPKNHQIEYSLITETLSISNPGRVLNSELFLTRPSPFTPPMFHEMDSSFGAVAVQVAQQIRQGNNLYLYFKKEHILLEGDDPLSLRELGMIHSLDECIFEKLRLAFIESSDSSPEIRLAYSRELRQ